MVHGSGFMPVGASTGAPAGLHSIRCAFGTIRVPASALSPTLVRCFTPPAARAAAFNEITIDVSGNATSRMIEYASTRSELSQDQLSFECCVRLLGVTASEHAAPQRDRSPLRQTHCGVATLTRRLAVAATESRRCPGPSASDTLDHL
jgi:hypothetical protein